MKLTLVVLSGHEGKRQGLNGDDNLAGLYQPIKKVSAKLASSLSGVELEREGSQT